MYVKNLAAGTGKTTTALRLITELIKKKYDVTYISITNAAVEDAKARLSEAFSGQLSEENLSHLHISTMHSFFLKIIRESRKFSQFAIAPVPTIEMFLENFWSFYWSCYGKCERLAAGAKTSPTRATLSRNLDSIFDNLRVFSGHPCGNNSGKELPTKEKALALLKTSIVSFYNGLIRLYANYFPGENEIRTIWLPLNLTVFFCSAYKLKPQKNQVLVIDEFQDMDQDEIRLISSVVGKNLWLFGDLNQAIYMFRNENYGIKKPYVPITTPKNSTAVSYRYNQFTADFLTNFLRYKNAIFPDSYSPIVNIMSSKVDDKIGKDAINIISVSDIESKHGSLRPYWSRYAKSQYISSNLHPDFAAAIEECIAKESQKTFLLLTYSSNMALRYSQTIIKKYGDVLDSWYISYLSHPLYWIMRSFILACYLEGHISVSGSTSYIQNPHFSVPSKRVKISAHAKKLFEIILDHGTRTGRSYTSLLRLASTESVHLHHLICKILTNVLISGKNTKSLPTKTSSAILHDIEKILNDLERGTVNPKIKINNKVSQKSALTAARSFLEIIMRKCDNSHKAIRLNSEEQKKGAVHTIHSAKGMEADYVLLDGGDFSFSPTNVGQTIEQALQKFNTLYVALSRHREKLWILADDDTVNRAKQIKKMTPKEATKYILSDSLFVDTLSSLISEKKRAEMMLQGADSPHLYISSASNLLSAYIIKTIVLYSIVPHDVEEVISNNSDKELS